MPEAEIDDPGYSIGAFVSIRVHSWFSDEN
jgi:hypothetical protein